MRHRDPIVAAFDRLAARDPTIPLVIAPEYRATVSEIDGLSTRARSALREADVIDPQLVGLLAANGPGFLAALVGCLRAGHAPVLFDPRADADETSCAADVLGVGVLLRVEHAWPRGLGDFVVHRPPAGRDPVACASSVVSPGTIVKLTSGSTGTPRGVVVKTEALLADDEALRNTMGIVDRDRLLAAIPFAHSYGLSSLVLPALVRGIPLVLADGAGPFETLHAAHSCGATVFPTVPPWISAMLRLAEPPRLPSTLRLVIAAGSVLLPRVAREFRLRFGLAVHVFYGASECGGIAYDRAGDAAERGTVGEPVEGVEVEIEPARGFGAARMGRVGVRSRAVAETYLPAPSPGLGDGRFVSQDLGELRGRELRLAGRLEDLVVLPGGAVNRREVELVIAELDAVEDVVVCEPRAPAPEPSVGVAVIACSPGSLTSESVIAWCRSRLDDHQLPRGVVFVRKLPRTTRGKIDLASVARIGSRARLARA